MRYQVVRGSKDVAEQAHPWLPSGPLEKSMDKSLELGTGIERNISLDPFP